MRILRFLTEDVKFMHKRYANFLVDIWDGSEVIREKPCEVGSHSLAQAAAIDLPSSPAIERIPVWSAMPRHNVLPLVSFKSISHLSN